MGYGSYGNLAGLPCSLSLGWAGTTESAEYRVEIPDGGDDFGQDVYGVLGYF
jgi:hypothetical protein